MNNKLTDERPDDESLEFLITIRREIAERHASEGRMEQCAVHTLILNALLELQKLRKADSEPAGYHVIKECGKVGCSVATFEEAEKTRDFWNKKWTIRPYFYSAAPAPVVPEEMPKGLAGQIVSLLAHNIGDKFLAQKIWNACRAAMLHGAEPVSQTNKLPHTQFEQVADLYEMQFDDGRTCAFHTDAQKAVQWLQACDGNRVQEYVKLERLQNALAGNSPVTPDGWISCSERMPAQDDWVLIYSKYGEYLAGQVQGEYVELNDGTLSWLWSALHWMPLPEPPQQ